MSSQIGDIFKDKRYGEPPEVRAIKEFVRAEVGISPQVFVTNDSFIVTVPSAAAAGTLRFKLFQLQRQLGNKRRIILRIG